MIDRKGYACLPLLLFSWRLHVWLGLPDLLDGVHLSLSLSSFDSLIHHTAFNMQIIS